MPSWLLAVKKTRFCKMMAPATPSFGGNTQDPPVSLRSKTPTSPEGHEVRDE